MSIKISIKNFLEELYIPEENAIILSEQYDILLPIIKGDIIKFKKMAEKKDITLDIILWALITGLKCAQSEEESRPIGTGFIIGNFDEICDILKENVVISLPKHLTIKDWGNIRKFCGYINGKNAIFIVDKNNGTIKTAKILPTNITINEKYFQITKLIPNSITILILGENNSLKIFTNGEILFQIILLRKYGKWVLRDFSSISKTIIESNILIEKEPSVVNKLIETAMSLSEIGRERGGSALIIGDTEELERKIKTKRPLSIPKNVKNVSKEELIRLATSGDGHTVLDRYGNIHSVNAIFNAEGGRLASIRDISKQTSLLGIVISQDALISIIKNGKLIQEI